MARNRTTPLLNSARGIPGPGRPKGSKNKLSEVRVEEELRETGPGLK
jgi:hypothetical protein